MNIYFNWLGKGIELNNENDTIHKMKPSVFVDNMLNGKYEEHIKNNEYIDIQKDNYTYHVPITSIVQCSKNSSFTNKERWD